LSAGKRAAIEARGVSGSDSASGNEDAVGVCASEAEEGAPLEPGVGRTGMVDGGGIARVAGDGGTWTAMMDEQSRFAPSKGRDRSAENIARGGTREICAVLDMCLVRSGRLSYVVPAARNGEVETDEMGVRDECERDEMRCQLRRTISAL
jgi:hypothetical protein